MKPIRLFALVACLSMLGCSHWRKPSPEEDLLYRIECFHQRDPDNALRIMDTIDVSALSAKEAADILGLTENTALKYRSNIRKKAGNAPISTLFEPEKPESGTFTTY